jgi:hypothetical protein
MKTSLVILLALIFSLVACRPEEYAQSSPPTGIASPQSGCPSKTPAFAPTSAIDAQSEPGRAIQAQPPGGATPSSAIADQGATPMLPDHPAPAAPTAAGGNAPEGGPMNPSAPLPGAPGSAPDDHGLPGGPTPGRTPSGAGSAQGGQAVTGPAAPNQPGGAAPDMTFTPMLPDHSAPPAPGIPGGESSSSGPSGPGAPLPGDTGCP